MGGTCSTPVTLVDAIVLNSRTATAEDGSVGGGYDITVRMAGGGTRTGYGTTDLKPGLAVRVAVNRSGEIMNFEDPEKPSTRLTRKGTLVYGHVSCKSDGMASKICSVSLAVLAALLLAGFVGRKLDGVSAILASIVGVCACTASLVSQRLSNFLATRVYDEQ